MVASLDSIIAMGWVYEVGLDVVVLDPACIKSWQMLYAVLQTTNHCDLEQFFLCCAFRPFRVRVEVHTFKPMRSIHGLAADYVQYSATFKPFRACDILITRPTLSSELQLLERRFLALFEQDTPV